MNVFTLFKNLAILLFEVVKKKLKQMTCSHRYKWVNSASGHSTVVDKWIVFDYTFKCVKCGKETEIKLDRPTQVDDEENECISALTKDFGTRYKNLEVIK